MNEINTSSYDCWDEWDEVDYDDHWEEYDDYTEYNEWDEHDDYGECYGYGVYADCGAQDQDYGEVDCPPGDTTYTDTISPGGETGGGGSEDKPYKILDIINAGYSKDGIVFEYLLYDKKNKTMIASTLHEELFVNVTIKGTLELSDGDYCVSSVGDISFVEITRINDYLKTIYITAADQDIYYDKDYNGTMIFAGGVSIYTQPNQVVCEGTAYAVNPAEKYIYPFFKVKDIISDEIGGIADIYYESSTDLTIVKAVNGTVYHITVFNAEFYRDDRYVRYKGDVGIDELQLAKQAVSKKFNVPYVDIVCDNNKITYMDNGGITYEILADDIGGYYYYEYDYYIPANAVLTSTVYIPTQPTIPSDYYRVVKQIQQMTGLPESAITQDDNGLAYVYGVPVYVPGAVKFGGQVYAKHEDVVSALLSAFVDIQDYLHSKGFYYGKDDNGSDYDSIVYDAGYKKMLLLRVGLDIDKRIRIIDGSRSYNLAIDSSYIETAVQSAFGISASELGRRALANNVIRTHFLNELYIRKTRVSVSWNNLYVNGSAYSLSEYQTSFNNHTYVDKTKLLALVKQFVPSIAVASIKPDPLNDTNYTLFANKNALIVLNSAHLDHAAVQVISPNGTATWYEQTFVNSTTNTLSIRVQLQEAGIYKLKVRGRTTLEPEAVNAAISHTKDCEISTTVTVYPSLSNGLVYLEPYANFTGCTVSNFGNYITVSYQHEHYADPETVTYYKSLTMQAAYKRQCSYNSYGMYLKRDDFRMDMDFDINTDNNKNRDWYLEKRVWRLWHNGKSASFGSVQSDVNGRQYVNAVQNGITRQIFTSPTDNLFYGTVDGRETIRLVNNHLVMPEATMFNLFGVGVRDYITSHYLMKSPDTNISGDGSNVKIFGLPLNVTCVFANDECNYSDVSYITRAMNSYFANNLVNVYSHLPEDFQNRFAYQYGNNGELGIVSIDGDEVLIPSLITKSISDISPSNYANATEYAKKAIYATQSDIDSFINKERPKRIVIYGGGFGGFCAAYQAAKYRDEFEEEINIVLINPSPIPELGGIGTVGGQNYWDCSTYDNKNIHGGTFLSELTTFGEISSTCPDRYNTKMMAEKLKTKLADLNVKLYMNHDIVKVYKSAQTIDSIVISEICRNNRVINYIGNEIDISGDVFIDASEDGKLTKLSCPYTIGRYDYPNELLQIDNESNDNVMHPACTLMFKLKATNISPINDSDYDNWANPGESTFYDFGNTQFNDSTHSLYQFNEKIKDSDFLIKPANTAQNVGEIITVEDGTGGSKKYHTWWINSLLIFNVDGTMHDRDGVSGIYPSTRKYMTTDEAWQKANDFLKEHKDEILRVYRDCGFVDADYVYYGETNDSIGSHNADDIVCGEVLYIRETIHSVQESSNMGHDTEENNYALSPSETLYAGGKNADNSMPDTKYRKATIGLAKYNPDIHPFVRENLKSPDGDYIWGMKSFAKIRNWNYIDTNAPADKRTDDAIKARMSENTVYTDDPINPVYIPYSVLTNSAIKNMLIPGYAANISSAAWGEIRVLPNLCVMGDAAGVAAVYHVVNSNNNCYDITDDKMCAIQQRLIDIGAKLYKENL